MTDYTNWPDAIDLENALSAMGAGCKWSGEDLDVILRGVIESVEYETRRQFVPGEGVRYFDGSGTGEQDVDEYVSVSQVRVLGYIGVPSGILIPSWSEVETLRSPKSRLIIARGSLPSFAPIWVAEFPEGRRNIEVTAVWGYGATIPADLWRDVLHEAASLVANEDQIRSRRGATEFKEGDESIKYDLRLRSEMSGSAQRLAKSVNRYRRPSAKRLRQSGRRMI